MSPKAEFAAPADAHAQLRNLLAAGLWLQRLNEPSPEVVSRAVAWVSQFASEYECLPPVGLLADWVSLLVPEGPGQPPASPEVAWWPAELRRFYEDAVLGRMAGDSGVLAASDALRRLDARHRASAVVWLLGRIGQRIQWPTISVNPAVVRGLCGEDPNRLLDAGWAMWSTPGGADSVAQAHRQAAQRILELPKLLDDATLDELRSGGSAAGSGERLALRQLRDAIEHLEADRPRLPRARGASQAAWQAHHLADESSFPMGGYATLAARGPLESLLPSQLAYMEPDQRPDLFDVAFLHNELLYYSRDESPAFRPRVLGVVSLASDLVDTRIKDPGLPSQRIVWIVAAVVVAIRQLVAGYGREGSRGVGGVPGAVPAAGGRAGVLEPETGWMRRLLAREIAAGVVTLLESPEATWPEQYARLGRRGGAARVVECRCQPQTNRHVESPRCGLQFASPQPTLEGEPLGRLLPDSGDAWSPWRELVARILAWWIGTPR